jgi:predicted PurR-regulated permease PerM
MYKQEECTRTYKNNWTKILFNCFYLYVCFLLYALLFNCFYLCVCFPLVCTFVQLFLSVRVYSSCMYLCSIVLICACVFLLFVSLFNCFYLWMYRYKQLNKCTNKRNTHAHIKTIEQRYKQEENTRTDKNNWTKIQTCTSVSSYMHFCSIVSICACVFLLFVPLFNCFYLCVCISLVCTFIQLFLSVRVF